MSQFEQSPVRRRANPAFVAAGILVAAIVAGPAWYASSKYGSLSAQETSVRAKIAAGDAEIQAEPVYLRVRALGEAIAAGDALTKWKEANPTWYAFVRDVAAALPKDVTIRSMGYSPESASLSLQLTAPSTKRLVQALNALEDMDGLSGVEYNSFVSEKVSFKNDKSQYSGYSTKAEAKVDKEWLKAKLAREDELTAARRSSVPAAAGSGSVKGQ